MNKKGFTLIELLSVLVILGIVITIAVQSYNLIFSKSDETKYNNYLIFIKKGTELYFENKMNSMVTGDCFSVNYQTLVDKDLIKEEDISCTGNIILRKNGNKYIHDDSNLECKTSNGKILKSKSGVAAVCEMK